ncbi:MAG: polysaccharide deacetylase family protein [Candidatus Babeliales bacterium]|jgi:peptidoglycan/xylan/chitin deacetylase (PgdA/CDA1 family)
MLGALFALLLAGTGFFLAIIPNTPQFFGTAVRCVDTDEKVVALTYDDGPRPPTTQGVLDVLLKHQVYATFFLIGERAEKNIDLVKKIYTAGHELGNHTYSHPVLVWRSPSFVREQIEKTDKIIHDCDYEKEIFFRSPKGMKFIFDSWELSKMKRINILFDAVGWDWDCPGVNKIVENVMDGVKPGSIILLHDGCGNEKDVVAASGIIITKLKAQGYRFLTISELLKKDKQNRFV